MDLETCFLLSSSGAAAITAAGFLVGLRGFVELGLGFTKAKASQTKEGLFGNLLYVWSDIGLGIISCSAVMFGLSGQHTALLALSCHQAGFILASAPVYGFRSMYLPCGAVATIALAFICK